MDVNPSAKRSKASPLATIKQERGDISTSSAENNSRMREDDERKKMYKRLYGRKKYQYRINNCNEDVKVSEEEIDAEIARSRAKDGSHPSAGMYMDSVMPGSDMENMTPSQILKTFVEIGSKEYKHEFKKARDRLYKRKMRILRTNGNINSIDTEIPRVDIEMEMITRYTSNKIKTETLEVKKNPEVPCTTNWWEMTASSQDIETDLSTETIVDLGYGPGGDHWISANDPMIGEVIAMEYPSSEINQLQETPPEHYYGVNTLEERSDDFMAF